MAKNSSIEWTDHTFNPWWGCVKLSPACKNCYAEAWSRRVGLELWGKRSSRRFFGEEHWRQPLSWNREAERTGQRRRVFCASMADVFEQRTELSPWRARLWTIIEGTPWLDWLLLTKRPEHVATTVPWIGSWPINVWLGTTVENQHWASRRLPELIKLPAAVRFLSCEPLLGPLDLSPWFDASSRTPSPEHRVDWVIAGGESGARARPTNPFWIRTLRDQCLAANVPFHFKQWGAWTPLHQDPATAARQKVVFGTEEMFRVGKKHAGRQLDGRTWDEVPLPVAV